MRHELYVYDIAESYMYFASAASYSNLRVDDFGFCCTAAAFARFRGSNSIDDVVAQWLDSRLLKHLDRLYNPAAFAALMANVDLLSASLANALTLTIHANNWVHVEPVGVTLTPQSLLITLAIKE